METFKFVLKNGRVEACFEEFAKANQNEVSKLTDPFSVVGDLPIDEDYKTSGWEMLCIKYMPEQLSNYLLDIDSGLYDPDAVYSLEEFKENCSFFPKMLPEYCFENPLMIGFFQKFNGLRNLVSLEELGKLAISGEPAPYRKEKLSKWVSRGSMKKWSCSQFGKPGWSRLIFII